jgi:uncharacterized protein GlcG (DUF336 family)
MTPFRRNVGILPLRLAQSQNDRIFVDHLRVDIQRTTFDAVRLRILVGRVVRVLGMHSVHPNDSIRNSRRVFRRKIVTLNDARRVIAAAEKKAIEIGQPMNIAVADEGGNLVAHVRMDGAWIGSIDISIKKAFTARAFDISTKDLATHSQSGGQFFGIHASNDGRVMIFAGGIPLKKDGKVVGAIGVSGGSGEQDHTVAEAGEVAF